MKKTLLFLFITLISLNSFGTLYFSNRTICQNDTSTETWTISFGSSISYWSKWYKYNYTSSSWNFVSSGPISTTTTHLVTTSDTGYYKIVIYNSSTFSPVDSGNTNLYLIPTPNSGIIYGEDTICMGSSVTLHDTSYNGLSSSNGWEFPTNSNVSSSNTFGFIDSTVITGIHPGLDTIYFTTTNLSSFSSCGIDTSTKIITILPTSSGIINGLDTVCVGSVITLIDTINNGTWTTGINTTITSTGLLSGVSIGFDTVSYTITNTCGTYITTKIIEVIDCSSTGIYSPIQNENFELFPNPTNDVITVSSDLIITDIEVINLIGQTVLTKIIMNKNVQINLSDLSNGVYVIRVNKDKVLKVIKQ